MKAIGNAHTKLGQQGKEAIRLGPVPLGGRLRGKKMLHRWRPSLGSELFKSHTEHPALESDTEKVSPLHWFQG